MPKTKSESRLVQKKPFLRPVHIQAIVFIVIYFIISNIIFYGSVAHPDIFISFFVPFIFGLLSCFIFLYLFSHEDFFHFIKNLDNAESDKEKKFLDKFSHYGKLLACILISILGGPIFLALSVRFLFPKSQNRYLIIFIANSIATILAVSFAKGFLKFVFPSF